MMQLIPRVNYLADVPDHQYNSQCLDQVIPQLARPPGDRASDGPTAQRPNNPLERGYANQHICATIVQLS